MDPVQKGKTLWEMLQERIHKGSGNGPGIAFYNPLGLSVGAPLNVPYANGPEFTDYSFTISEIREYNRRIGGQDYRFADYVLSGANTKTFNAAEAMNARIRTVPNPAGAHDSLLLKLYDEFAFAEDFLEVLKDTTGIFEVTDDSSGAKETFNRINDLKDPYDAAVMIVSASTPDLNAAPGKIAQAKIEYWDYWRDVETGPGTGATAKEFIFIEQNSDTGWFQIWRGREFYQ
jgi:hypothetical protein